MKRIFKLLLVLVTIFAFNVRAEEVKDCAGGPAGTDCATYEVISTQEEPTKNNQAFYADDDLVIDKDIDVSAFMFGKTITSTKSVFGSQFAAGGDLNISGNADYGFLAGQSVKLHDYKVTDSFIAGKDIELKNIDGRTFYVAGQTIKVEDSKFDKLYLAAEKVILNGDFKDLVISANKVIVNGTINGTLEINESAKLETEANTTIDTIIKYKDSEKDEKFSKGNTFVGLAMIVVIAFIKGFINLLIIGVIIIYCFNKVVKKLAKQAFDASFVFGRIGIGLCTLIVVPVLSIIALFTSVASLLGVILILAYILGIIITTPIVTIYLSDKLLKSIKNDYLRYCTGLLVLQLIKKIPVIGGLVTFLTLCLGLGLLIQLLKKEKKEK